MQHHPAISFQRNHKEIQIKDYALIPNNQRRFANKFNVVSKQRNNATKPKLVKPTEKAQKKISVNLSSDSSSSDDDDEDDSVSLSSVSVASAPSEKKDTKEGTYINDIDINTPMYEMNNSKQLTSILSINNINDTSIQSEISEKQEVSMLKFKSREEVEEKLKQSVSDSLNEAHSHISATNSNQNKKSSSMLNISSIKKETQSFGENSVNEMNSMLNGIKTNGSVMSFNTFTLSSQNSETNAKVTKEIHPKGRKAKRTNKTIFELSEEENEDNLKSKSKLITISKKNQSITRISIPKSSLLLSKATKRKESNISTNKATPYSHKKTPWNFFEEKKKNDILYHQSISLFHTIPMNDRTFGINRKYSLRNRIPKLNVLQGEKIEYLHSPSGDEIVDIESNRYQVKKKANKKLIKPLQELEEKCKESYTAEGDLLIIIPERCKTKRHNDSRKMIECEVIESIGRNCIAINDTEKYYHLEKGDRVKIYKNEKYVIYNYSNEELNIAIINSK